MMRSGPSGSESARPSISVVIAAFTTKRLPVLKEAIASVRAQSLPAHEIVLVIDHSPELLAKSRELWPEIRIVENRELAGVSGSRNLGSAESTGDVVAFLDDDAVPDPDWLQRLADDYSDPNVFGVGGTVTPRWPDRRPDWFPPEFDWVVGCTHSGLPRERTPVRNLVGANSSFRRDRLLELGGFSTALGRVEPNDEAKSGPCEETELCIRMSERWQDAVILYDPDLRVEHVLPPARCRFRYFRTRCMEEGRSKAVLAELVGTRAGLSAEREYVRRTLRSAVIRGLRDALRGEPAGLARAGAIMVGLSATAVAYVGKRTSLRRTGEAERLRRKGADRLRILMVTPRTPLALGGVERHVMEVARRLSAAGAEVTVLCAEPGGHSRMEIVDGFHIRTVRAWPAGADWRFAPGIWREMGRDRWDLVHVQSYHTFVAPLAMLRALVRRIPYVLTFHGGGHSSLVRNRIRRLQRRALRPLLARAERLIALARFEVEQYGGELRIPRERFALIPNGTDLLPVAGDAKPAVNGDGPVVLATIGRLERYKGHHRVIDALPHVLERRPETSLLVVGTGPYENDLRARAAALGVDDRVEFTSVPPNDPEAMAALLGRTSLVVLLSDFETHPLTALEAAAAGRRLLVADRGGLAEVAEDGFARAVSPDEPPAAIADAIVEELGRAEPQGRPRLASWDECAGELLALYRSIARP